VQPGRNWSTFQRCFLPRPVLRLAQPGDPTDGFLSSFPCFIWRRKQNPSFKIFSFIVYMMEEVRKNNFTIGLLFCMVMKYLLVWGKNINYKCFKTKCIRKYLNLRRMK
jgi:hypothetical protein